MPRKMATEVLMPVTICTQIMKKSNLFHASLMYCFQPSLVRVRVRVRVRVSPSPHQGDQPALGEEAKAEGQPLLERLRLLFTVRVRVRVGLGLLQP